MALSGNNNPIPTGHKQTTVQYVGDKPNGVTETEHTPPENVVYAEVIRPTKKQIDKEVSEKQTPTLRPRKRPQLLTPPEQAALDARNKALELAEKQQPALQRRNAMTSQREKDKLYADPQDMLPSPLPPKAKDLRAALADNSTPPPIPPRTYPKGQGQGKGGR